MQFTKKDLYICSFGSLNDVYYIFFIGQLTFRHNQKPHMTWDIIRFATAYRFCLPKRESIELRTASTVVLVFRCFRGRVSSVSMFLDATEMTGRVL